MSDLVTTIMHGDVAELRIDSPPVNALDAAVREALAEALDAVDARARAVVLACAGRTFVAGASVNRRAATGFTARLQINPTPSSATRMYIVNV